MMIVLVWAGYNERRRDRDAYTQRAEWIKRETARLGHAPGFAPDAYEEYARGWMWREAKRREDDRLVQRLRAEREELLPLATWDEYQLLRDGEDYLGVCVVIGSEGREISRVAGVGSSSARVTYRWPGVMPGSGITATFQGGKLVAKAQIGLR